MSLIYIVLMVAVAAVLLFVMAEAVLSVSRRPQWQTAQQRLASEGATLHHLPKSPARQAALPAPGAAVVVPEAEALAA